MADFHQEPQITTLHALYEAFDQGEYLGNLERRLESHARHDHMCLLLPSLFSEISNGDVLDRIVERIAEVRYLRSIVVALGGASDESQFREAQRYFGRLARPDCRVRVVWVDGPRVQNLLRELEEREIPTGMQGKGQSVWVSLGYLFARDEANTIALHDCDIVTYDRIMLGRLIEPVANPNNAFQFCKGYYARISPDEFAMKGRVTRLFVTPFVDTLSRVMCTQGMPELQRFFEYHRGFKYPLAGEFCFTSDLARGLNIAYDWGLEVATLSQVYDQLTRRQVAQIDLAPNYEHKHQELSPDDTSKGLHRMVVDIAKFYLTYMRSHGVPLDDAYLDMLLHTYYQTALTYVRKYSYDADVNNLAYDLYAEEAAAGHFRGFLWDAWMQTKGPQEAKLIPSWNRVAYSFPQVYERLLEAVEADQADCC
ncbi:MAG: glycosyl transferase [Gammaproteobacteria bacterium]|jgi:glucosyl-3-phosphoglycerate synthase|nr:glycosyl transferase [Gammaproteobacteria bacterium]